ncbi:MAG: LamG-like jellyroll fold domain-containing protein [Ignavibacteriaceae bacterium]|nr:LamG-like jellyroll fold domain-containing protein [Ignavibacteriaceae bacterium]
MNNYVDMGNAQTFDVGTAVTYEAWINPDTTQHGFIFNKWVAFQEDKQVAYSANRISFFLFNAFGGSSFFSSPSVPTHQYTHIAATYNSSTGTASIYINGVLDTSKNVGSTVSNSNGNLYYGFNPVRGDNVAPFKGIIDEVRIWNIARTESEIQSTMNQTLNGNEPGLVGYWKFDEGTGTITYDATGNHNDGTIYGATWVGPTYVETLNEDVLSSYLLEQNYPNPFNPSTKISWQVPVSSHQTIKVYDILGNEVATLVDEFLLAGNYEVEFQSTVNNHQLVSGVYFYTLRAGSFVETKKMILMK